MSTYFGQYLGLRDFLFKFRSSRRPVSRTSLRKPSVTDDVYQAPVLVVPVASILSLVGPNEHLCLV